MDRSKYGAVNEDLALENLISAKEKWGSKYPNAIKRWDSAPPNP
ncbi:MAG TPA: hypothetical protein VIM42_06800 [Clostridium sp.]